ncbi:hypothetical protein L218DRAFT_1055580 [Marasmius fiardii PR-910]|nr:hypothetical protein L218DRAFT_1055580 [Marasmius fiardii PR-910]
MFVQCSRVWVTLDIHMVEADLDERPSAARKLKEGHTKALITLMVLIAESLRTDVVLTLIANVRYLNIVGELAKIPPERFESIRDRVQLPKLDGPGDVKVKIQKEVSETGGIALGSGFKMFARITGGVVSIPQYPPMDTDFTAAMDVLPIFCKGIQTSDGALFMTTACVEPEAITALKERYRSDLGKDLVLVGLASSVIPEPPLVKDEEGAFHERDFERAWKEITFGTFWWPKDAVNIYVLVDEIQTRTPFLFSQASPFANMPSEVTSKIADSGFGKLVKWAPQDTVLQHPATGWFITHGSWKFRPRKLLV